MNILRVGLIFAIKLSLFLLKRGKFFCNLVAVPVFGVKLEVFNDLVLLSDQNGHVNISFLVSISYPFDFLP